MIDDDLDKYNRDEDGQDDDYKKWDNDKNDEQELLNM